MKKIAIFGYSVMSFEVMARLNPAQYEFIFIAQDDAEAALVKQKSFPVSVFDFRNDDDLSAIGIGSTIDIIFCFYPADSDNVFLTISARNMAKNLTIIAIVDDPESAEKLLAAGADKIIDPYEICGRKTHDMITRPDISNILDNTVFGQHDLTMAQITLPEGSPLQSTKTSALKLNEQHNLILIGVVDNELGDLLHFAIGEQDHTLDAGDVLVVMGPSKDIRLFKQEVEHVAID